MPTIIVPERPDSADAIGLIAELDAILDPLYPSESRHGFSVDKLLRDQVAFFVIREDEIPAGCGGVRLFGRDPGSSLDEVYGEVKRMYVRPTFRGRGLAKLMLNHLADYARGQGVNLLRLETGIYQPEAIGLYERYGFRRIGPFGDYREDPLSLCYELRIG